MLEEETILTEAIRTLRKETGLKIHLLELNSFDQDSQYDAQINIEDFNIILPIKIIRWADTKPRNYLRYIFDQFMPETVLVTNFINPLLGDRLKDAGIQFLDTIGNAYIANSSVYIHIIGKRSKNNKRTTVKNRAFEPTGLRVVYALLCFPDLLDTSYRNIAEKTGVSTGAVSYALKGLSTAGYLIKRKSSTPRLVNKLELFERWISEYANKLKPKLLIGHYHANNPNWWKAFPIRDFRAVWGGEIAADRLTGYLHPEIATIYVSKSNANPLIRAARLKKIINEISLVKNIVSIYSPIIPTIGQTDLFNDFNDNYKDDGLAHPILVYSNLISSGDPRNIETARIISDKYLFEYLSEN